MDGSSSDEWEEAGGTTTIAKTMTEGPPPPRQQERERWIQPSAAEAGTVLRVDPGRWRTPRAHSDADETRLTAFKAFFKAFDWTEEAS